MVWNCSGVSFAAKMLAGMLCHNFHEYSYFYNPLIAADFSISLKPKL